MRRGCCVIAQVPPAIAAEHGGARGFVQVASSAVGRRGQPSVMARKLCASVVRRRTRREFLVMRPSLTKLFSALLRLGAAPTTARPAAQGPTNVAGQDLPGFGEA